MKFFLGPAAMLCLVLTVSGCTAGAKKKRYSEAAESAYKAGQYDKARIEYLNLLRVDPENARAYAQTGAIWAEEGAPLRAGAFLLKALELAPNDNLTRRRLARAYLLIGHAGDARKEARTLLANTPDDGQALVILTDASRTPEETAEAEQELAKFPKRQSAYFHLAAAAVAAKKADRAAVEPALQEAVAADPNLPMAHTALASWYRAQGDFQKAAAEFEKAANAAPIRSTEKTSYAEFKMQMGALDEAETFLKNITKQAPDFLPAWSLLAKIANRQKKYDEALRLIENALGRDPVNVEARVVQAESWLAKNETKKAFDSLESLDHTYPQTPIIKYALARAYLQNGNSKQAMAELDEVVRISPSFPEAVLLQAQLHLANGDAQSVVQELETLARGAPQLSPVKVLLAEAYRMLGRLDEAASVIEGEIKRFPQNASYQVMLGMVFRQQNKLADARRAFEKALELDPGNSEATGQLVDLDLMSNAYADAHRRIQQLLQKRPDAGNAFYLEGKVDAAEGKFDEAQVALLKAIELDPNQTLAYELLIPIYARANKLPEALSHINAIVAKRPDDVRPLLLSGLIYDRLKDSEKARQAYEKVLTLSPNSILALNNLAYIYAEKLNDLKRARELAQKARSLAPADPSVLDTLGWIVYRQGEYQQAADLLGQSAAKNPDGAEIQYHLGMANYMMGRSDAARAALEKAVGSPEDFAGKDEARQRLRILDNKENVSAADLEVALKSQPNDPIALFRLAEAYEREGASAKAAQGFERALAANPNLASAAMKLAQLYGGPLRNPEKALQFAKKARELSPADPRAAATVGALALQLKNARWAYSLLQGSARELPKDAVVLHDLAWAAYSLGKVSEAREAMQRALDADPTGPQSADARTFLSMMKFADTNKELPVDEKEVSQVLAAQPSYLPALAARARLEFKKDTKAAEATCSQILEMAPDFAPAQRDLAALLIDEPGKAGAAYDLASKARENLGDDPKLLLVLARSGYERKEFGRAVELFQQAARQQPLDPISLYYLGLSYAQTGRPELARRTLNAALQQGLQEPKAEDARRILATLAAK